MTIIEPFLLLQAFLTPLSGVKVIKKGQLKKSFTGKITISSLISGKYINFYCILL